MKCCSNCGENLPDTEEYFQPRKILPTGRIRLTAQCRKCLKRYFDKFYELNREYCIGKATKTALERRKRRDVREKERESSRNRKRKKLSDPTEYARHLERGRAWRKANPARVKALKHEQPAMKAHRTMVRYTRKKNALPAWVDLAEIRAIYKECAKVSLETGIPHEVDHIIPLGGKLVSGLHVPWNLQIIPATVNRSKGAKVDPELCWVAPVATSLTSTSPPNGDKRSKLWDRDLQVSPTSRWTPSSSLCEAT